MAQAATTGFETTGTSQQAPHNAAQQPPVDNSDEEERKIFIGGLKWETDKDQLSDYFSRFGNVVDSIVMINSATGQSRGFGFVTFDNARAVDDVLASTPHILDGRQIDPKRAVPRGRAAGAERVRKIFVGGLGQDVNDDELRHYFESFGRVEDVLIQRDRETNRPRGFGFVTFGDEDMADRALQTQYHEFGGRRVEVKPAIPKGQGQRRERPHHGQGYAPYNGYNQQPAYAGNFQGNGFYPQGQPAGGYYGMTPGGAQPYYGQGYYGYMQQQQPQYGQWQGQPGMQGGMQPGMAYSPPGNMGMVQPGFGYPAQEGPSSPGPQGHDRPY